MSGKNAWGSFLPWTMRCILIQLSILFCSSIRPFSSTYNTYHPRERHQFLNVQSVSARFHLSFRPPEGAFLVRTSKERPKQITGDGAWGRDEYPANFRPFLVHGKCPSPHQVLQLDHAGTTSESIHFFRIWNRSVSFQA